MKSDLQRNLGLPSTTAIAIGAMVGSGIFILPGIAYAEVGPAVVVAYLLAGLLVLPAALSAAEMATAMPEDGGSYVYVERGMGPLLGTIAGIGNWFMLSFKGALALIGGVPYLVYVAPELASYILPIALGLAIIFTVINIVSTKSTGGLQFAIVGIMVLAMAYFVLVGIPSVDTAQTEGSFNIASKGILAATGLVFVSYAGVIKIAAVAEEIKNPAKTIPRAMIGSLVLTTLFYVLIVYVAIGVAPDLAPGGGFVPDNGQEVASLAYAAEAIMGEFGAIIIVFAALLALASTANAGLLSASRFPFAMARDGLVPTRFARLHSHFKTPILAVGLTGAMMMVMIATLPIEQVAKFGSAFQIVVFILVNLAVIGFREGAIDDYQPAFISPLYPWLQIVGMTGGIVVLTQMGTVPFIGAVVITILAISWYLIYVRNRVEREGAAKAGLRESVGERSVARTKELFESNEEFDILVGITNATPSNARQTMVRIAGDMGRIRTTVLSVIKFEYVPHRIFAGNRPDVIRGSIPEWLLDTKNDLDLNNTDTQVSHPIRTSGGSDQIEEKGELPDLRTHIEYRKIQSESTTSAIVDVASYEDIDLILLNRQKPDFHDKVFGSDIDWILDNAPADVLLVDDRGFKGADEIAVVANTGLYDPVKLLIADVVAEETNATINLIQAIPADSPMNHRESIEAYHTELMRFLTVPARSTILETNDPVQDINRFLGPADLLITGVDRPGFIGRIFRSSENTLVDSVEMTSIQVHSKEESKKSFLERLLMDHLFG